MRHRIWLKRCGILVAAMVCIGLVSCSESTSPIIPADASAVPATDIEVLVRDFNTGIHQAQRMVIRSEDAWEAFWEDLHGSGPPSSPPPGVDFSERQVVAISMGSRSTGGYVIDVVSVDRAESMVFVTVRETSPGPGCGVTQATTSPVLAVAIPHTTGDVRFVEEERTLEC